MVVKAIDLFIAKIAEYGQSIIVAAIYVVIGLYVSNWASKIFAKAMQRTQAERTVVSFMKSILNASIKLCFFFNAACELGFSKGSIAAVFGTIGAALALGFKDNLSSLVSGLIILFTKPFLVGDYIEIQGNAGRVKAIQVMCTEIVTLDNKFISIPNNVITSSTVTNYSKLPNIRIIIDFGVDYNTNIDLAKNLIMKCMTNHPKVLEDPEPYIAVTDYGASAITITAKVWTENANYWTLKDDLLELVKKEFDTNGIVIPFNQLDIHMKGE